MAECSNSIRDKAGTNPEEQGGVEDGLRLRGGVDR